MEYYAIVKMNKLLPHAITEKSHEYDDGQKKFNHKEYILSEFPHKIPKEANESMIAEVSVMATATEEVRLWWERRTRTI